MESDFIEDTEINGVYVIRRPKFGDERGFFRETFRRKDLESKIGFEFNLVQANHSRSQKGVLRGIHAAPWHKLTTVMRGEVQQVVVDLRPDSPTFKKYISVKMGEEDLCSVFIPSGCGNAFLVLSDTADYNYLTTDYWEVGKEFGILYNDPDLNIKWELENPEISFRDKTNPTFKEKFPD
jgi:dTDP-4-dehydrorhamnose 3,5-epimerase